MCASEPHCYYQILADGQVGRFNLAGNRLTRNVSVHTDLEQVLRASDAQE